MLRFVAMSIALTLVVDAGAHHSVLNYDGKVEITITGTVSSARFGYPHSIYRIDVTGEDGSSRAATHSDVTHVRWTLETIAPGDGGRLEYPAIIR